MRRRLVLLLLFTSLLTALHAQAPAASPDSERLRAKANVLLRSGSSADAAEAAGMLDKASEIDARAASTLKTQAELKKLQEPAPSGWGPFVIQLTPFLSFVIVALTFVFNSYQTRKESQQKREEAVRQSEVEEEKRFNDAIALIQKTENFSPAVAILSTFANGPFAPQARQTAMSLLLSTRNFDNFLALFNSYVEPVTSDNLREVLYLLRSVSTTVAPLLNKTWINGTNNTSVLTPPELEIFTALTQQRRFLGFRVAMVLSQPRKTLEPIDLGGTALDSVDLKGADLRQCVSASAWNYVNLDGADLRGMTGFEYAYFLNTAWWQAGQIDTAFLDDLMARYPHQAGQFLNTRRAVTPESYQQDVARLRALAEQAGGTAAASGTMPSST